MTAVDVVTIPGAVVRDGLLFKANAQVAAWCDTKRGRAPSANFGQAIGILRDGADPKRLDVMADLIGGVVFFDMHDPKDADNWSMVKATVVSEDITTARPHSVKGILSYAFDELGVALIAVDVDHTNDRSRRSARLLGFEMTGSYPGAGSGGGDIEIYGLDKSWCPYFAANPLAAMAAQRDYVDGKTNVPWWRAKLAA
jgi:RimJ/RimL family protein N-acetyltransferase